MIRHKSFSQLYVKYMIKSPIIFYLYLIIGLGIFLCMSFHIILDVLQSEKVEIEDNQVIFSGYYYPISETIYIYQDRNNIILPFVIKEIEHRNNATWITIENHHVLRKTLDLEVDTFADIVVGKHTLLERIFIKVGRGQ